MPDTTKPDDSNKGGLSTDTKADPRNGEEKQSSSKSDDDLTIGEFIDRHSISSEANGALRDMNNNSIAKALGLKVQEVVDIQRELGHKLPEGAN